MRNDMKQKLTEENAMTHRLKGVNCAGFFCDITINEMACCYEVVYRDNRSPDVTRDCDLESAVWLANTVAEIIGKMEVVARGGEEE